MDTAVVSGNMAKSTLLVEDMIKTGALPDVIVKEKGLVQISDAGEMEKTVDDVIAKQSRKKSNGSGQATKN